MASDRIQRRIDSFLDEADAAAAQSNWTVVRDRAQNVLAFDPENAEAQAFLAAADRALTQSAPGPASPQPGLPVPPPTSPPTPPLPASFAGGRYQVKRFLGEGGKKRVYLAHDTLLDRDVAFALIKADGLDESGRARVLREAQAMGRLGSHPHIVTVFDLGQEPVPGTGQGQPYMVSELMGGGDVEGLIEKASDHKLPLEQALRIAVETCQGLEFAHGHGIIHRDLKPGNVWLTQPGVAKIGDFGLAVATDRSRLTQVGMMVGTVAYMPPEQATGGQVTARSDLYSLGCMLYEMVTGRPPFVGDNPVAIIGQHLNTPPIAPAWHRPDLPPTLQNVILQLLEKDPSKRPASAAVVRQALEGVDLSAHPVIVGAGLKPAPTDAPPGENPIYRHAFVGREPEMKQLQAAWDGAVSGQGSLQMIVGEPGIGKTTLWEQLATYVSLRNGRALIGHCYEEGSLSLPYLPFVEAMRSYVVAREPEALKQELGSGAEPVARIVSEIRDRIPIESHPAGDPEEERYRLLQAVSTFLRNASAVQPILLVLEDLHDADRGTLDLLVHLARNLQGARLLVVGTYRDVEVDRSHPLSAVLAELRRVSTFARVLLRGLTVNEVHRLVSILSTQETTVAFAEAIFRQTEGNPLFVQEVLRYLVEEGLITHEEGRWQRVGGDPMAQRIAQGDIPEGLRDVIGKRLSRLSQGSNRVLSVASVMGREFRLDALQVVVGVGEEELFTALEEAKGVGILEERGAVGGAVNYRFSHAFFRQTLYEEIIAPRRIRMHQQVARALEQVYGRRLEEHAVELAEHFSYSSEPGDLGKAVHYGEMAARRSMAVVAYSEAASHLERCLQVQEVLDPEDKLRRCDLLLALATALMPAGEPQRVFEQVAEEAFALAEALGDGGRASHACQVAREALVRYGNATMMGAPVYRRWAERADHHAASGSVDRVYADVALAHVRWAEQRYAQSNALRAGALELARRLADPEALFEGARAVLAATAAAPRRVEGQLRLAEEFIGHRREGVSAHALGTVFNFSRPVLLDHGQRERAEALQRELETLAGRTRDPELILSPIAMEGVLALLDGRLEEAVAISGRFLARAEELGSPVWGRQFVGINTMRPLLHLGRAEEALAAQGGAARMAGLEQDPDAVLWRRSLLLAHLGRRMETQAVLRQLPIYLTPGPDGDEGPVVVLVGLLEAVVLVGDREAAAVLAQRLAPAASLAIGTTAFTCPARHLGAAMALLGEYDKARAYYQQALEVCARVRFRPEIALTRLQLAELLLDHYPQERKEALGHLDFAIAEFRVMKMQPSLERALGRKGLLGA